MQETAALLLAGLTACLLAAAGWGAWSLVAQNLVFATAVAASMLFLHPWRPSFRFDAASLRELLHFSLHLQAFNLLNYWLRNLDKFLIGRLLGDVALGHYNRAYTTMLLPQSQITGTLERVLWPALSRCAHDPERLRDAYLRTLRIIALVSFPFMVGLAVTAPDFVVVVFGPAWEPAVAPLQWLCIAGFLQTPVSTLGWLYLASGRTRRMLAWSVLAAAISIPAIVIGALAGSINSVAIWYAGSSLIIAPLAFVVAAPLARLTFRRVVASLAGSAAAALAMAGLVTAVNTAMAGSSATLRLAASTITGILAYALFAFRTTAATEARHALLSLRTRHQPPIADEPAPVTP